MRVLRGVFIGLTFLFLLLVFTARPALAQTCAERADYSTLVCGSTPNSALGFGAVDICGDCYPCGVADGVCPEDFYTSSIGRGSCRFCPDPDCQVSINGMVENADGTPINGASVIAIYEPNIRETIATSLADGTYQGLIRTGFVRLFVRYEDFDSRVIYTDIERLGSGIVKTIDFTGSDAVEPGTCQPSCTDTFGNRCKASCDGINSCTFKNATVALLCDDKIAGTLVYINDDDYIVCCDGFTSGRASDDRFVADPGFFIESETNVSNLVTYIQRTRRSGERVNVNVAVWN